MAIAVHGGHAQRALDFYNKEGKYFIIGGSTPWTNKDGEGVEIPVSPVSSDYKLRDIIGLKSVDEYSIVKPVSNEASGIDIISYNGRKFQKIIAHEKTNLSASALKGSSTINVANLGNLSIGKKIRIANLHQAIITNISGLELTLDTELPENVEIGAEVVSGALVEDDARYVYITCTLENNSFPVTTFRQVGVCTEVIAQSSVSDKSVLRAAKYSGTGKDEFASIGVLEILDNLPPNTRHESQSETLSLLVEF